MGYQTSDWYPFNKFGRIENPKSTAAVGAMLCLLALDLRLPGFYFKAGDFEPYSTIRYFGMIDANQQLTWQQGSASLYRLPVVWPKMNSNWRPF